MKKNHELNSNDTGDHGLQTSLFVNPDTRDNEDTNNKGGKNIPLANKQPSATKIVPLGNKSVVKELLESGELTEEDINRLYENDKNDRYH